ELRGGVKLMAVPAFVLQDADLGKPLRDEEEVPDGAGARDRARHVRGPRDVDRRRTARLDRLRERNAQHRSIVPVAVVGGDETLRRGQVATRRRGERRWA